MGDTDRFGISHFVFGFISRQSDGPTQTSHMPLRLGLSLPLHAHSDPSLKHAFNGFGFVSQLLERDVDLPAAVLVDFQTLNDLERAPFAFAG